MSSSADTSVSGLNVIARVMHVKLNTARNDDGLKRVPR